MANWLNKRRWAKQVLIGLLSCLIILSLLALPRNQDWMQGTVQRFYQQRQQFGAKLDRQSRERAGYGKAYQYVTLIKQHCKPTDYFLIPPQRYLIRKAYRIGASDGYAWLYPSVLYYHLGQSVQLLDMTMPDTALRRATFTFWVKKGTLELLRLTSANRRDVLATFRQYNPSFFAYTPEQARQYYRSTK